MKDELYFMTVAVLALWRSESPMELIGCVLSDPDGEYYELKIVSKKDNLLEVAFDIFDGIEYANGSLYLTEPPSSEIIEAAVIKKIKNIIYIPKQIIQNNRQNLNLIPFVSTFGKIIDILSGYKPRDILIDM